MTQSLSAPTLRVTTCRAGFSASRPRPLTITSAPDETLRMRHIVHEINQPLTAIVLLSELKMGTDESDPDTEAIYTAALQLRDRITKLQHILHSIQQPAPPPANLRVC